MPSKLAFLLYLGTHRVPHSGSTLLMHLLATSATLDRWGCNQSTCDAGLFHSIYGTQHTSAFIDPAPESRYAVRQLLGDVAERLVWLIGALDRDRLYCDLACGSATKGEVGVLSGQTVKLTETELSAICHILAANWLDHAERDIRYRSDAASLVTRALAPLLNDTALHEFRSGIRSSSSC